MAKRIPFSVVFATGEDPDFPASELNTHGPTIHGWRSAPKNSVPIHDIILRFHKPAKVCRIQVLAHQYLIPQKIELWLHYSPKSMPSTPSSQCFDYLGFIALSDNATTKFKSRELQSVSVTPRKGTHLKLRIGTPHVNEFNTTSQIALIAVNVLGGEIDKPDENPSIASTTENGSSAAAVPTRDPTECPLASMCDDLLFSMYVEEGIAEIVREMEHRKIQAVNAERFEYARKLKLCMTVLRNAGERLGRYSLAKRQAVQQEDFTTAKLRKEQIEIYRDAVLKYLEADKLLEKSGVRSENDECSDLYASKPTLPSPPSLQDVATVLAEGAGISRKNSSDEKSLTEGGGSSIHTTDSHGSRRMHNEMPTSPQLNTIGRSPNRGSPISSQGSLRRRNRSAPKNSYEDYEERAIPALRHSHTNEFLRECQGAALLDSDPNRGRSRLNDRERRQAALPILVFGIDLVEQFYSRQFQDREDGLMRLRNFLKNQEGEYTAGANKIARSAALLLHRAVRDAVYSVFSQATESVRVLFAEFVPNRVSPNEVARCVDRLLPELLAKSGDPSPRIHTLAQHTILSIAACPEVREQHLVAPALSRTVGSGTHPRLALSRVQMLEQLVLSQGISTEKQSGLTCRVLSECGCSGIHHPAEPVRKVAERVLLLVYKVNPRLVRKQLPPDDDVTRRNLLYRQLFTEFDKLDMQRKKEMLEANKQFAAGGSDPVSPSTLPRNGKSTSISPTDSKTKSVRCETRNGFGFQSKAKTTNNNQSSPMRRSETRILKSKSGTSIHDTENINGKQEYNEKLKQTINSQESRKSSNSNSESYEEVDVIRCPFCDWSGEGGQTVLDKHYWKACPFLTKCPQCSQVLEVAALNYHLTNECEAKSSYISCERCTESVHKSLYELHLMEDYCREIKTGAARCPLCHDDVHLPLDGGWKLHLLCNSGCPGNARRRSKV